MTARNENDKTMPAGAERPTGDPSAKGVAPARRRLVLRGAAAAVPTILTLHSGSAAAARSSFLISKADGAPVGADGKHMCMDLSGAQPVDGMSNVYDLGDNPAPQITKIDGAGEYYKDGNGSERAYAQEICETGDVYYKKTVTSSGLQSGTTTVDSSPVRQSSSTDGGWLPSGSGDTLQPVQVQGRGMLVSATALRSFAAAVTVREI